MPALWKWAAASRCGTSHAQAGERRQDAFRVLTTDAGVLVAVACDGAGSTTHGGVGAAIAAWVLTNKATRWIDEYHILPSPAQIAFWVGDVRSMLAVSADRIGVIPGDFATTLVMAISDGADTITAHIGDGAIIARDSTAQKLLELSWPENGEHAATTFFVTDNAPRLRIGVMHGVAIDRLALFTDGMERLALDFPARAAHAGFFDSMFGTIGNAEARQDTILTRHLAAFLDSDTVCARTDDDNTLILAAFG